MSQVIQPILNVQSRTIFCLDNLRVLEGINSGCIDLVYLDPPFNKKKQFTAPTGSSAEGAEFSDIFREEDIKDEWVKTIRHENNRLYSYLTSVKEFSSSYNYCYLVYMAVRLLQIHRVLKNTGSVYLHCDPTMSHYLKVVLDCIFGEKNFKNEIVWKRHSSVAKGSQHRPKSWGSTADNILFYSKSSSAGLSPYRPMSNAERLKQFPLVNEKGERYYNDSAHIWSTPNMGARPNLCYEWKGFKNPHPSGWRLSKERMDEEYKRGNIVITPAGKLERRKYERDYRGKQPGNIWTDIDPPSGDELTNYPTQKPTALLKRIIEASTNEGDVVLDPFCGCATTCIAAELLNRRWIGVDVSQKAYELVKIRIEKEVKPNSPQFWRDNGAVNFTTIPPQVTDAENRPQKYVYIISNPAFPGLYKVGVATNAEIRLSQYQTSDPNRGYKLEYKLLTPHYSALETHIHNTFPFKLEWVSVDEKSEGNGLEAIKKAMENFKPDPTLFQ